MDEYLFIALARLKADRLKFEREHRVGVAQALPEQAGSRWRQAIHVAKSSPQASWKSQQHLWREQS